MSAQTRVVDIIKSLGKTQMPEIREEQAKQQPVTQPYNPAHAVAYATAAAAIISHAPHDSLPLGQLAGNTTWPRTAKRKAFLFNVFVTALEGGIGYWSVADEYHHSSVHMAGQLTPSGANDGPITTQAKEDHDNFHAIISPTEGKYWDVDLLPPKTKQLTINIDTIEIGILRFWEYCLGERDRLGYADTHDECNTAQLGQDYMLADDAYWRQFLVADITNGDDGDYDADVADQIVQLALFNSVVFA